MCTVKNRYVPYGYKIRYGRYEPEKQEQEVVVWIFESYLQGLSCGALADRLTARTGVQYKAGEERWNKSHIKRILDNEKYIGTDTRYPAILDKAVFEAVQDCKAYKNTRKNDVEEADALNIKGMAVCGICGANVRRRKRENGYVWISENNNCICRKNPVSNAEMEQAVQRKLHQLIQQPAIYLPSPPRLYMKEKAIKQIDAEVEELMECPGCSEEQLKKMILECAVRKYALLQDENIDFETQKIRKILEQEPERLLEKGVRTVYLLPGITISLELTNGVRV